MIGEPKPKILDHREHREKKRESTETKLSFVVVCGFLCVLVFFSVFSVSKEVAVALPQADCPSPFALRDPNAISRSRSSITRSISIAARIAKIFRIA